MPGMLFDSTTDTGHCPRCRRAVDTVTKVGGAAPVPRHGSVLVCQRCLGLGIYFTDVQGGLRVRLPTPEEDARLSSHPTVLEIRRLASRLPGRDVAEAFRRGAPARRRAKRR